MRPETSPGSEGRAAHILLVEDDPGDRRLTMRALAEGKIRNVCHVAQDGEEALDYLCRRGKYKDPKDSPRPDVVLLDLNLPRIDGREVLEKVRADPALRGLVIVVLTTSDRQEDVVRAYELGANSYIRKPVTASDLAQLVSTLEEYWFQIVKLPTEVSR